MAPLSWPMAALGMASVAVGSAIPRPRKIMGRDVAEDIAYYCQGWDLADAASISKLWNEGDNAVGTSMASFAQDVVGDDYPNHKWADHMMEVAQPNVGDNGLGGCGIPGGECDPNIECEDFANRGFGELYWPLRALVGMHSKLNIAHEWLQDATIESILSLSEIASDFTAPPATTSMDSLASMFGAIFYFVGGAAGMGAVAASAAATRAVSQSSRLGNLKASRYTVETKWRGSPVQQKLLDSLDARIANAQTRADEIAASGASLGTFGAATYFIGGTFGIVGLGYDPETDGQIIGGDLEPALRSLFQQGRDYLESVGRMAAGHAVDGTDYNLLPGQRGGAEYWEENAIAYFYNDGRMLLSEADTTFNDTIKDAFSSFKPRVVDMAMTKSNFHVLAEPGYESEEQCTSLGSFGTRYIDGLCTNLWQWYPDGTGCPEGSPDRCQYIVMSETQHKALTDKYGYDIYTYMKSQIDCAKSGGTPGKADFDNLLEDGATPLCWFGVEAHKGTWAWSGIADTPGDQSFETEDW